MAKTYSKLAAASWARIRRLYERGVPPREICDRFGVSRSTLMSRRKRERWAVLQDQNDRLPVPVAPDRRQVSEPVMAASDEPAAESPVRIGPDLTSDLRLVRDLRERIEELLAESNLGMGSRGRVSRSALDLAQAIEKLQKIERTALGLDQRANEHRPHCIVLVPPKMAEEEWLESAEAFLAAST